MTVSRRRVLGLGALSLGSSLLSQVSQDPAQSGDSSLPPIEIIALNRMAFGACPGDVERLQQLGFEAYVEEQLHPQAGDPLAEERIAAATLPIQYEAVANFPAVDEIRSLTCLQAPLAKLWKLTEFEETPPYAEWSRPVDEVRAATWIRAVYSRWQLREVLVDFWHNHFNVKGYNGDMRSMLNFPRYDQLMRRNCLGNFRAFLGEVARSTPMLVYLNNASSKASPANENFARELLELHTLGVEHYFNDLYDRWRDVPGASQGQAEGYIDQDVYEAARAFTGWTIADGTEDNGNRFPNTGEFYYYDSWHDPYQKRFLGIEFPPNQPPMADGDQVLDLVAYHPGTAKHLCTKLCRRLVADDPPSSLVEQAAETWMANQQSPQQIQQTVRTILRSPEFAETWGQKVKRPFEVAVSFLRATAPEFKYTFELNYLLDSMGQSLFDWATPTGHPDHADYWLGTSATLRRWYMPSDLMADWVGMGLDAFRLPEQIPAKVKTGRQMIDFWVWRLLGRSIDPQAYEALLTFVGNPDEGLTQNPDDLKWLVSNLVTLIATTPDFQWR